MSEQDYVDTIDNNDNNSNDNHNDDEYEKIGNMFLARLNELYDGEED